MNEIEHTEDPVTGLQRLFRETFGIPADTIHRLPGAGSDRKYFRLSSGEKSVIGVAGEHEHETVAFVEMTRRFRQAGLNVPELFGYDPAQQIYLVEDLGDTSLFGLITARPEEDKIPGEAERLYHQVIEHLVRFQFDGHRAADYSYCWPVSSFDAVSMMWDLNYFKYYFLRLNKIRFDEHKLETDFRRLTGYLDAVPSENFMYRDFQSRNIMIRDDRPWFIDYQGGRKGAVYYDLASLLWQARARLPKEFREKLIGHYILHAKARDSHVADDFENRFAAFSLMRMLQVLGAYGLRGSIEKKPHFVASMAYARKTLADFLNEYTLPVDLPELRLCLDRIVAQAGKEPSEQKGLTVTISSFSFIQQGVGITANDHGGGFVFDCRSLPNPGRYEAYRLLTGLDKEVADWLWAKEEVREFNEHAFALVSAAVQNYLERGFDTLAVGFGCTGGRHRSVFCAGQLASELKRRYPDVRVVTNHLVVG